jgi:hypothetical protein
LAADSVVGLNFCFAFWCRSCMIGWHIASLQQIIIIFLRTVACILCANNRQWIYSPPQIIPSPARLPPSLEFRVLPRPLSYPRNLPFKTHKLVAHGAAAAGAGRKPMTYLAKGYAPDSLSFLARARIHEVTHAPLPCRERIPRFVHSSIPFSSRAPESGHAGGAQVLPSPRGVPTSLGKTVSPPPCLSPSSG